MLQEKKCVFNNMQVIVPVEYAKQCTENGKSCSLVWRIPDKPEDYNGTKRAICIQNIQKLIVEYHTQRMLKIVKEKMDVDEGISKW